jgi:uncharacterized protein (TIGR02217 family)
MSNAIFPQFAGLKMDRTKTPEWKTVIHQAVSGKESRSAFMSFPIWNFTLCYEVLRADVAYNELKQIMSFYNERQGSYDSFLYNDKYDNTVTNQGFGTGTGSQTKFQLVRNLYNWIEPVQNVQGTPTIKKNGTALIAGTDYTIGDTGIVTFTVAPNLGDALTWEGLFYYRVRFVNDTQDFDQFMYNLWEVKQINLRSIKL